MYCASSVWAFESRSWPTMPGGVPGRAAGDAIALKQHRVGDAAVREVVEDRRPDDAAAEDDDRCAFGQGDVAHFSGSAALGATRGACTAGTNGGPQTARCGRWPACGRCCLRGVDRCGVQAGKAAGGRARPLSRRRSALRTDALRCSVPRPAAELAARAALAPLRQLPRVSSRSALARAAAGPALLGAAHSLAGPTRPQPCGQRQRVFDRSRNTTGAKARGQCPDGAHGRRRAAQRSEGKPGVPAGPARSREVGAAFSGAHGGIAAALAQRAAQRTLAAGEGGDG